MRKQRIRATLFSAGITIWMGGGLYAQSPLGTGFAYQGQLDENGAPLSGPVDLRFSLHDALTAKEGQQVGSNIVFGNYQVAGGVFAVELDFGVAAFNGQARYLQIEVRSPHDPTDTEPYTTLEPRLPVSATPYALQSRGLYVDEQGNLSIGDAVPNATAGGPPFNPKAHSATAQSNGVGMFGEATSPTGATRGLWGKADSPDGQGVAGESPKEGVRGDATGTSGDAVGIKGTTASPDGRGMEGSGPREGVRGHATETTGNAVGIKGTTASPDGRGMEGSGPHEGVRGHASETSGNAVGIRGITASAQGRGMEGSGPGEGVRGMATDTTGNAIGMKGTTASPDGRGMEGSGPREGVRGEATESSGTARGVCGISASTTGEGVLGHATAATGTTTGVQGISDSTSGIGVVGQAMTEGVRGEAASLTGDAVGVRGITGSSEGAGVMGCLSGLISCSIVPPMMSGMSGAGVLGYTSGAGAGVAGWSESQVGPGVMGTGLKFGVSGKANGPGTGGGVGVYGVVGEVPDDSPSYGVHGYAQSSNPESAGVLAEGQGNTPPLGQLDAAALEIRNGAINVSGHSRPAGTIPIIGAWSETIESCDNTEGQPPAHFHVFGYWIDVDLDNSLVVSNSIILVTVELEVLEGSSFSYFAHVHAKSPGQAKIRITAIPKSLGGACDPPSETVNRSVHYLIINPVN